MRSLFSSLFLFVSVTCDDLRFQVFKFFRNSGIRLFSFRAVSPVETSPSYLNRLISYPLFLGLPMIVSASCSDQHPFLRNLLSLLESIAALALTVASFFPASASAFNLNLNSLFS